MASFNIFLLYGLCCDGLLTTISARFLMGSLNWDRSVISYPWQNFRTDEKVTDCRIKIPRDAYINARRNMDNVQKHDLSSGKKVYQTFQGASCR